MTKRGSDYLKASVATTLISSIIDVRITIALGFALVVCALISQLLLAMSTGKNVRVELEKPHLSVFRGEEILETANVISKRRNFVSVRIDSVSAPVGVEMRIEKEFAGSMEFSFKPGFAGRFKGLNLKFALSDPLELFQKTIEISKADFVLDSLPKSLLSNTNAVRPVSLSLGERSGKTSGSGQEFYSIDEYHTDSERRDILWKKVARMPDDRLLVRIRESNIPKTLKIGLIRTTDRSQERQLEFNDLMCEGCGLIGKILLSIGCDVEMMYTEGDGLLFAHAADLIELSHGLMEMSASQNTVSQSMIPILSEADICITGLSELQFEIFSKEISRMPSLLIKEPDAIPFVVGERSVLFSGTEDVGRLVNAVVSK